MFVATVLLVSVAVSGCGRAQVAGSSALRPAVIPWVRLTRPIPRPAVWERLGDPTAPLCAARDLGRGSVFLQGATQSLAGRLSLTNISTSTCVVVGAPHLVLLADGRAELRSTPARSDFADAGQPRWPGYPRVALLPGERTYVGVEWSNVCRHAPAANQMLVVWHGGHLRVPFHAAGVPACGDPTTPPGLAVGGFQPDPAPFRQLTPLPLRVTIHTPATIKRGQLLRYTVTVTNYSHRPIRFATCPAYWQGLGTQAARVAKVTTALVLNCASARHIPPRGHTAYAMRLPIPATAPTGTQALVWAFEPIGLGGLGKVRLVIH